MVFMLIMCMLWLLNGAIMPWIDMFAALIDTVPVADDYGHAMYNHATSI